MPENGLEKVVLVRFQEQSIAVIELTSFLSDFNNVFLENGFKTSVREDVFLTRFASPNLTSFAALHFLGSSCFSITTFINMIKI